ncbi:MAG: hypothetical protein QW510_04595 [Candidatus Bathyarchaeia archaeon]
MKEFRGNPEGLYEEFAKFMAAMEELHFLRLVAQDLKSFRRMLKFKRFD